MRFLSHPLYFQKSAARAVVKDSKTYCDIIACWANFFWLQFYPMMLSSNSFISPYSSTCANCGGSGHVLSLMCSGKSTLWSSSESFRRWANKYRKGGGQRAVHILREETVEGQDFIIPCWMWTCGKNGACGALPAFGNAVIVWLVNTGSGWRVYQQFVIPCDHYLW